MVEDKRYEIGSRVECDGYRGTLKYVGPVANTKGQWLGIDWDDPSRGKHNGTYEGTEYFTARHPTSGSFIRPGKAKFGISCPVAIKERYGLVDDELAGIDRDDLTNLKKEMNAPFLEMVGFSKVNKKQSKFNRLKVVCLRDQCISSAGMPDELKELCPNIEELDLSKNLIDSWKIVADICSQLHSLDRLDVSENQIPTSKDDSAMTTLASAFSTVTHLNIARMNYTWTDVLRCVSMFPNLRELSASFNIITTLEEDPAPLLHDTNLAALTSLTLEGNCISEWNQILTLGSLSCLEFLNVNSIGLEKIRFPTEKPTGKTNLFPALQQLRVSENNISEWRSVSELEKLVSLIDLKIRGNPILKNETEETGRQLVIARIAKLEILNGTEISRNERRGAEYDYLKLHLPRWQETENDSKLRSEFIEEHPRYPSLVEKYGISDIPSIKTKVEMVSNVIRVEFVCPDDPNRSNNGIKRKLLKDMEVQKVIGLAQRLFKTGGKIPVLSFVRQNKLLPQDEIPLDKPLQELGYYSIQDGDRVLVRW